MTTYPPLPFRLKLFADGASIETLRDLAADPRIAGFTTNPTLMRKAGVTDYRRFALEALDVVGDRPISFEVFADEIAEMRRQALEIAAWGPNVDVKIPVTTTSGKSTTELLEDLSAEGVRLNVTALTTLVQVEDVLSAVLGARRAIISVFAGRIADTGRDPLPIMRDAAQMVAGNEQIELLWASPRELLNIFHAEEAGCDIITATSDVLAKLGLIGKDLDEVSLDTVKMFFDDGSAAGYAI